jgi:hypothetical protein
MTCATRTSGPIQPESNNGQSQPKWGVVWQKKAGLFQFEKTAKRDRHHSY